jgi:hypothetical protein
MQNPRSKNPQSQIRNPQSKNPQSEIPNPKSDDVTAALDRLSQAEVEFSFVANETGQVRMGGCRLRIATARC